jgi:hypothetical protein
LSSYEESRWRVASVIDEVGILLGDFGKVSYDAFDRGPALMLRLDCPAFAQAAARVRCF